MVKLFKEPLVHFLMVGALLFGAYEWLNRDAKTRDKPRVVRITSAEVAWLKETWSRQWQRQPSDQELRGLVADYLKESLLAREARELGLDDNDTIVRRRLAQKMDFLVQDTARLDEPGDDKLREYHATHGERFRSPARISFTQVFFKTEAAARQSLNQVATQDTDDLGERSLLERDHAGADEQAVASLFGPDFAGRVFALEPGSWHGPLSSAYGFHLVRVGERVAARQRSFEEVRAKVLEQWQRERQQQANEQFYTALFEKYDVVIDESVKPLLGPLTEVRQ